MASTDYEITSLTFSTRTEVENGDVVDQSNKVGVPHDEISYLVAHIEFKYFLNGVEYAGTCIGDIAELSTISFTLKDNVIQATTYSQETFPDKATIDAKVESLVEDAFKTNMIRESNQTYLREALAKANKEFSMENKEYTDPQYKLSDLPGFDDFLDGYNSFETGVGYNNKNIVEI